MTERQVFGSALRHPWVLVKWNDGAGVAGQRPKTVVAYLTDDCGDHYLGGLVGFYRRVRRVAGKLTFDPAAQWHFRYARARTFAKADVAFVFPSRKSRSAGPTPAHIRAAKKSLPRYPQQETA